jgi:hypothetical protein
MKRDGVSFNDAWLDFRKLKSERFADYPLSAAKAIIDDVYADSNAIDFSHLPWGDQETVNSLLHWK